MSRPLPGAAASGARVGPAIPSPTPASAAAGRPLHMRMREAVVWYAGFNRFREVLQFGTSLLLARLLAPEAYGQYGFGITVVTFLSVFSIRHLIAHALQVKEGQEVPYQDHFTAGLALHAALCLVLNGIALVVAQVPSHAGAAPLLHLMSLLFFFHVFIEFRVKMLERALDWRRLRTLHALGLLGGQTLSVLLALNGAGAYALVVPSFVAPLPFAYDLFVRERWRPAFTWRWARYTTAVRFAAARASSDLLIGGRLLVESSLFVTVLSFEAFGLYGRAVALAQLLCAKLAVELVQGMYPVLVKLDARRGGFRRITEMVMTCIAWVALPFAAISTGLADSLVSVLYGERWTAASDLIPLAMLNAALSGMALGGYWLLLARGQPRRCLVYDGWAFVAVIAALALALPVGLHAYQLALGLVASGGLALILRWLWRDGEITGAGLRGMLLPPLCGVAAGYVAGELTRRVLGGSVRGLPEMLLYGLAFGVAYAFALRVVGARLMAELSEYLPGGARLRRILLLRARLRPVSITS